MKIMQIENLEQSIRNVTEKCDVTVEEVENKLINYLNQEYFKSSPEAIKKALIQQAKNMIISTLYNSTSCQVSEGWNRCSVIPSYKSLLWIMLGPAHHLYFDQIVDELLSDGLIYTEKYEHDKEPKTVGLNEKGILYKAKLTLL